MAAHGPCAGPDQTVVHLLLDRLRARAASRGGGVEREVPRRVRPGLGRAARADVRTATEAGRDPARRGAYPEHGRASAWDSLSDSEKRLYARQMEVYAGYQENCDWNVGRLLDAVGQMGELDNTLVFYIFGDNGASMEGTITGSFNELTMQNGIALTPDQQLSLIGRYGGLDAWGADAFAPHYASAWAWAGNAPFQWGKQVASHLGGTRNGMVVSWPDRIRDAGGCGRSSPTASTSDRRSSKRPGSPRQRWWTGPSRSRSRGRASCTASTTRPRLSGTPCSTSRSTATGRSTRTAGGRPACSTGSPGTRRRRRSRDSPPGPTTPSRTTGAVLPARRLHAGARPRRRAPRQARRAQGSCSGQEAEKHNVLPLMAGFSVFFGILPPMPTITTHTFYGDVQNIASGMIPASTGTRTRSRPSSQSPSREPRA